MKDKPSIEVGEVSVYRESLRTTRLLLALSVTATAGAAYYGVSEHLRLKEELASSQSSAEKVLTEKREAQAAQRRLMAMLQSMEADLQKGKAEKDALASQKVQLEEDLQKREEELAKAKATFTQLSDKLQAEIKKGEILLSDSNGKIRVDLVDRVLFDSGQAELSPRGQEVLSRVAEVLKGVEDKSIQVSGHTDDSPITERLQERFPTNWELSAARAVNVVRHLSEAGRVPRKRLVAAGYGEFHPVASNASPAGRAANRRIEILLTPEVAKVPSPVVAAKAVAKAPSKVQVAAAKPPAKPAKPAPAKKR